MKKKKLALKKLALDKSAIASLNGQQQAKALGGASQLGESKPPCGHCNNSQQDSCICFP